MVQSIVNEKEIDGLSGIVVSTKLICSATGKHAGIVDEGLDPYTTYAESLGVDITFDAPSAETFIEVSDITNEKILEWSFAIIDKEGIEQMALAALNEKWKFLFETPETRVVSFTKYENEE